MARSQQPIQSLTAADLGIDVAAHEDERRPALPDATFEELAERDETYAQVRNARDDGFAGVILVGNPGSGKSYLAHRIALAMAGDVGKVRFTQFHPSYQYEDFVEGWTPNSKGGFDPTPKHFRVLCEAAEKDTTRAIHVMVIDELNRCDAARVFGEALTYIETTKRGVPFRLASGAEMRVPHNVFIIATMNPWDRGVDEVDAALLRRFAQILMPPRTDALEDILRTNGMTPDLIAATVGFLEDLLRLPDERLHIGHAYFANVRNPDALRRLWDFQLQPLFKVATRGDDSVFRRVEASWNRLVVAALDAEPAEIAADDQLPAPPPATGQSNA